MSSTIANAQTAIVPGFFASTCTERIAALTASLPRSSIIGTDTTLTANTRVANIAPAAKYTITNSMLPSENALARKPLRSGIVPVLNRAKVTREARAQTRKITVITST